jgi:ubiquinone/menaquinone biosynthesis C-methylase UbiE
MHRVWKDCFVAAIGVPAIVRARQARAAGRAGGTPEEPLRFLDVAGGTGDISFRIIEQLDKAGGLRPTKTTAAAPREASPAAAAAANAAAGSAAGRRGQWPAETPTATVTVSDINPAMLGVGKQRAMERFSPLVRSACRRMQGHWGSPAMRLPPGCLSVQAERGGHTQDQACSQKI